MNIKLSVVIPVFNSSMIIGELVKRLLIFLKAQKYDFEIILVNDGSTDKSWDVISELFYNNDNIISIDLSRNYGQHSALLSGFREASGDYIITMDDDLQNPPEEIENFFPYIKSDYELVFGKYKNKKHSLFRKSGSILVNYAIKIIFFSPQHKNNKFQLSNFRLIKRKVIDLVIQNSSADPYIPGIILQYSKNISNVEVEHLERQNGKSGYSFKNIIKLVVRLFFNHSTIPLRFIGIFGAIISLASFSISLYFFIEALYSSNKIPGWPSLAILISFFSGFILLTLSIIGEYIIFILKNLKNTEIITNKTLKK